MSKRSAGRALSANAGHDRKKARRTEPISFQLFRVEYVPEDDHSYYLEGRCSNPDIGGVCAVTSFPSHFYLETRVPFPSETAAGDFLRAVQSHISTLKAVTVTNEYGADSYKERKFESNLGWPGCKKWSTVAQNLEDFCVSYEMSKSHRTFAHWMPDEERLDLVKITVRAPYMTQSLHLYFESDNFTEFLYVKYGSALAENYRVRTFGATVEPALFFCLETGVQHGRWCSIASFDVLPEARRRTYQKTNLVCQAKDLTCDLNSVDQAPMVTCSFDCEMVSKRHPDTGRYRFPVALAAPVSPWDYEYKQPQGDHQQKQKDMDVDQVIIIHASIFVRNDMGEDILREGKSFVYKHPGAPSIANLGAWRQLVSEACVERASSLINPHCAIPRDLSNYWGYDKIEVQEYDTEMEIIYAFQDYLHEQDIDVVTGWNIDFFDFPFLFKRWIHHCKVMGESHLPQPNFGYVVGGCSKLSMFKSQKKAGPRVAEGASVKKGKSYDSLALKHLCMVDGLTVWNTSYTKKDLPHTLNSVSSKNLDHSVAAISAAAHLALKKGNGEDYSAYWARDSGAIGPNPGSCPELKVLSMADLLASNSREVLEQFTREALETEIAPTFSNPDGKKTFPMKKVEFKHEYGERYWKSGGGYLLRFAMYCSIDCVLPVLLLKNKGVMFSQLSFSMITGMKLDDILGRGQQAKVNSILLRACKEIDDGIVLPHDRGYHHFHWPCIFRHPLGCKKAVLLNIDRLGVPLDGRKPSNEGGLVQKPFEYGLAGGGGKVVTTDAASMYPTRLETSNLCSTRFLTSALIAEKKVPRYLYAKIILGSAADNFCGERVSDHEAALEIGCNSDDLKVTFFYQKRTKHGVEGEPGHDVEKRTDIMPRVVVDLAAKRTAGKNAKALWFAIHEHCKARLEEEMAPACSKTTRDGISTSTVDGHELLQVSETFPNFWADPGQHDLLLNRVGLSNACDHARQLKKTGTVSTENLQFVGTVKLLKTNVVLVHLLKRLGGFRVACPSSPDDLKSNASVLLLVSTIKSLAVLTSEQRTFAILLRLSKIQYENFDLYQLEVKRAMNSVYGVLMRANGAFALPEIGTSITSLGRRTISEVKCTIERQTTEYAKNCAGLAADAEKPNPSLKAAFTNFGEGNPRYVFAGVVRRLHRHFVHTFYDSLRVEEFIKAIYGDTDSIMALFVKHNVVNVEQAFAVLLYLVQMINSYCATGYSTPRMTKFEDEKISRKTVIYQQKRYDMYATYKIEKSLVELLPAGSNKSDSLPFLNELMSRTSEEYLVNLDAGYSVKDATEKLVFEVKKRLLDFATEKIDPEELTTSTKLSTFDPSLAKQTSMAGNIAARMLERGEPVCAGERITYLRVQNRSTGVASVEEYGYFLSNLDTLAPDLSLIWENVVRNKLTAFLRHLVCPLNDIVLLETVYLDREIEKTSAQAVQLELQANYLSKFVFGGQGDLEWRLGKRKHLAQGQHKTASTQNLLLGPQHSRTNAKVYPKLIECLSCFNFFDPKVYVAQSCSAPTSGFTKLEGNPRTENSTSFSSFGHRNRSTSGATKKRPVVQKTRQSSSCGSASLMQSWLAKGEPLIVASQTASPSPEPNEAKPQNPSPQSVSGNLAITEFNESLTYKEVLLKSTICHVRFEPDSALLSPGFNGKRGHLEIEYEDAGANGKRCETDPEEKRFVLAHLGEHKKICPECQRNEAKIPALRKKHRKLSLDFFEARALCLICIEIPQVPLDDVQPDTPETCTMTVCEIYKKKKALQYSISGLENELEAFEATHTSW